MTALGGESGLRHDGRWNLAKGRRGAAGKAVALPRGFVSFEKRYAAVAEAFDALGDAIHEAGPLTARERRLVKLAIAAGGRLEGAVRAHARRGSAEGIDRASLDHVAVLALTTAGLPTTVAALTWIEDALAKSRP